MSNKEDKNIIMRTQKIKIKKGHRMYPYFDDLCFKSKNLYNVGNFYVRQCLTGLKKDEKDLTLNEKEAINYINSTIPKLNELKVEYYNKRLAKELSKPKDKQKEVKPATVINLLDKENSLLSYGLLDGIFKLNNQADYINLPGQVNQQTLRLLFRDWKSFFESLKDYKKNPSKYKGRPKPPRYAKKSGRKPCFLSNQICLIKDNKYLKFPKTSLVLNIGKLGLDTGKLKEVRIIPYSNFYEVEIVMEYDESSFVETEAPSRIIGIDLGVNNFATIANNIGLRPLIIKGKVIKSINQYYNKKRAYYYGILRQGKKPNEGPFTSQKLQKLDEKRNAKVNDFMHKASRSIINYCVKHKIDTIIIGKNEGWKQNLNIGKKNNQTFVNIPYSRFIEMLKYKSEVLGIKVITTEESYTSRASFLDNDDIPSYKEWVTHTFSGRRIKRGLYKSKEGILINADVNGALNIIKKVVPNAFDVVKAKGNRGFVTNPLVLSVA